MKNYQFVRPQSGAAITDLESNIAELTVKVAADFGSLRAASDAAFQLYEAAKDSLPAYQQANYLKLASHFKLLADLAEEKEDAFRDLYHETMSYEKPTDPDLMENVYNDSAEFFRSYPNPPGHGNLPE